ncbi:MAG: hypothetical protein M1819_002278 [Sarea resinae]|nr:MAG: hypothetical protein M1819_002278 [Sarea resinae]
MASRIQIPLDALTSRLNLGARFDSVRSQSISSRFANLKPVSEFLDVKRLSKPADFTEVQTRVNYNLSYFSSNYVVVFAMLSIYSLLTNILLLFVILFVMGGMYGIGKLGGRDLELGFTRLTTSQLYTTLFVISVPLGIIASPLSTALWLIGATGPCIVHGPTDRECFFRGGGLGGRPRTPYDVPQWGRPSGARQGRDGRWAGGRERQWGEHTRFEELDSEDDDYYRVRRGSEPQRRFVSDELRFTGLDLGQARNATYDDSSYSDELDVGEEEAVTVQLALRDIRDKEEILVERALQRIRRAQLKGESNVTLTRSELDALERKRMQTRDPAMPQGKKGGPRSASSGQPSRRAVSDRQYRPPQETMRPRAGTTTAYPDTSSAYASGTVPPGFAAPLRGDEAAYVARGYGGHSASLPPSPTLRSSFPHSPPSPRRQRQYQESRYYSVPETLQPSSRPQSSSSRTLPDDPNWIPRSRSASSTPAVHPIDALAYQTHQPSRGFSGPPEVQYSSVRRAPPYPAGATGGHTMPASSSDPTLARRPVGAPLSSDRWTDTPSTEDDEDEDDDDDDSGVHVEFPEIVEPRASSVSGAAAGGGGRRRRPKR